MRRILVCFFFMMANTSCDKCEPSTEKIFFDFKITVINTTKDSVRYNFVKVLNCPFPEGIGDKVAHLIIGPNTTQVLDETEDYNRTKECPEFYYNCGFSEAFITFFDRINDPDLRLSLNGRISVQANLNEMTATFQIPNEGR